MAHDEFVAFIDSILENASIRDSRFQRRDVEIRGASARMTLGARATVSIRGGIGQLHWGVWRIDWLQERDRWRIVAVAPEMIDGYPIATLRRLRGYLP